MTEQKQENNYFEDKIVKDTENKQNQEDLDLVKFEKMLCDFNTEEGGPDALDLLSAELNSKDKLLLEEPKEELIINYIDAEDKQSLEDLNKKFKEIDEGKLVEEEFEVQFKNYITTLYFFKKGFDEFQKFMLKVFVKAYQEEDHVNYIFNEIRNGIDFMVVGDMYYDLFEKVSLLIGNKKLMKLVEDERATVKLIKYARIKKSIERVIEMMEHKYKQMVLSKEEKPLSEEDKKKIIRALIMKRYGDNCFKKYDIIY